MASVNPSSTALIQELLDKFSGIKYNSRENCVLLQPLSTLQQWFGSKMVTILSQ